MRKSSTAATGAACNTEWEVGGVSHFLLAIPFFSGVSAAQPWRCERKQSPRNSPREFGSCQFVWVQFCLLASSKAQHCTFSAGRVQLFPCIKSQSHWGRPSRSMKSFITCYTPSISFLSSHKPTSIWAAQNMLWHAWFLSAFTWDNIQNT